MKYLLVSFILSLVITPIAFAQEDAATSYSSITTQIDGSSTVSTHIETTVNGQTKVLDSNNPGTYTVTNSTDSSDDVTIPIPSFFPTHIPLISPTPPLLHKKRVHSPRHTFFSTLQQFLHKLFGSF